MLWKLNDFSIYQKYQHRRIIKIISKLMQTFTIDLMIFLAIMLCYIYVVMSEFFTHRKCNYIHETAVSILLGVLLGVFITFNVVIFTNDENGQTLRNLIILVLLPPMLFEDGYNIRKRKFFQNIMYINLYGIIGTILHFMVLFGIFYGFNHFGLIRSINNEPIYLKLWQMLAMSSCLCSIDTVVPEKIVNPERYPKLFSIIFGQSIMKDTIAVTLFDSIITVYNNMKNAGEAGEFDADAIGFVFLKFLEVFVCSILIGIGCALITTLLFKNFRFLMAQKGVAQVALIILTGYQSYILSEWAGFSGVISMLFCGITLSHFNVYNLTPEGKSAAKIAVSSLALVAQGLLFFLLGAFILIIQVSQDSDKNIEHTFSWSLLLIGILALVTARFINVYLLTLIGYLIVGHNKWKLNAYEYQIMTISGLVKGAIPFALILTLPTTAHNFSTTCVQNTVIVIVFLTSLFLNSIMPKILRNRLNKIDEMIRFNVDHPSLYDSLLIQYQRMEEERNLKKDDETSNFGSNKSDNRSEVSGRNLSKKQLEQLALYARLKSTTQKYWRRCQQGFLKPHLIYDYYNRKQLIKMEKIKMRKEEAQDFWKQFRGENFIDPKNEEDNRFIDVKIIQKGEYSQDEDNGNQDQTNINQLVYYPPRPKTHLMEQQIPEIKADRSKTQSLNIKEAEPQKQRSEKQKIQTGIKDIHVIQKDDVNNKKSNQCKMEINQQNQTHVQGSKIKVQNQKHDQKPQKTSKKQ